MRGLAATTVLLVLMGAFGFGVYRFLEGQRGRTHPQTTAAAGASGPVLAGTMYLAQGGALFQFQQGKFRKLTAAEGWMQPAASPDGTRLVAVKRGFNFSDLYLLGTDGKVQVQLTHNFSTVVELNHWAFFPRFNSDGSSVFFSYDAKDPYNTYRVDLAVYAMPVAAAKPVPREWTYPNQYTGGDVSPIPLKSGGLIYSKFAIDADGKVYSQVWIQARAGSAGLGLTKPEDNCGQPALAASQAMVAMVCHPAASPNLQLVVASLDAAGFTAGPLQVLTEAPLLASPAFSPDGQTIAYFAPVTPGRDFQLWTTTLASPATAPAASPAPTVPAKPPAPRVIGPTLTWDSGSAPVWI